MAEEKDKPDKLNQLLQAGATDLPDEDLIDPDEMLEAPNGAPAWADDTVWAIDESVLQQEVILADTDNKEFSYIADLPAAAPAWIDAESGDPGEEISVEVVFEPTLDFPPDTVPKPSNASLEIESETVSTPIAEISADAYVPTPVGDVNELAEVKVLAATVLDPINESTKGLMIESFETAETSPVNYDDSSHNIVEFSSSEAVTTVNMARELVEESMAESTVEVAQSSSPEVAKETDWRLGSVTTQSTTIDTLSKPIADPTMGVLEELIATIDETCGEAPMIELESVQTETEIVKQRYVVFSLANTKYAIPISNVIEMGRIPRITPVPNVPEWIRGVTNMRGDILSVIEFRAFLGIAPLEQLDAGRMLIVRGGNDDLITGLIVDNVGGLRELSIDDIAMPSAPIKDKVAKFMKGVYDHHQELLTVLDLEQLLSSPEIRQLETG
ncbi:MAG: chemotaxis protein CheW [Acidobacteriota bacterium]